MPGAPVEHYIGIAPQGDVQEVRAVQGLVTTNGQATHTGFILWLAIIGVVLPILIIGGLRLGGFSFVFKHR